MLGSRGSSRREFSIAGMLSAGGPGTSAFDRDPTAQRALFRSSCDRRRGPRSALRRAAFWIRRMRPSTSWARELVVAFLLDCLQQKSAQREHRPVAGNRTSIRRRCSTPVQVATPIFKASTNRGSISNAWSNARNAFCRVPRENGRNHRPTRAWPGRSHRDCRASSGLEPATICLDQLEVQRMSKAAGDLALRLCKIASIGLETVRPDVAHCFSVSINCAFTST